MYLKCLNCHYLFETEDYGACPRCSSKKLARASKSAAEEKEVKDAPVTRVQRSPVIMGDTKSAWQNFHSSSQSTCPKCGGKEFNTDFKHKEKMCKNCGELVSIRRHMT